MYVDKEEGGRERGQGEMERKEIKVSEVWEIR